MQHNISDSIYGLTLAWITSENSTKQLECRHLDSIFFAGPYLLCYCVRSRLHLSVPVANPPLLSPTNSLLASRYLFRLRRDFKSKNPLSGFEPKQTKESSAWRATYIVLQSTRSHIRFFGLFFFLFLLINTKSDRAVIGQKQKQKKKVKNKNKNKLK